MADSLFSLNTILKDIDKELTKCSIGIDTNKPKIKVSLPERYIINKNACILFWKNGEKTVVKRCADDKFNPRLAFLTAFFQHYVDMSKNKANKYLASLQVEIEPKQEPKHMKEETEFKVGNRVEVIKKDDWSKKGWKGKIVEIDKRDTLPINVLYDNGQQYWIKENQLKLIKEEK